MPCLQVSGSLNWSASRRSNAARTVRPARTGSRVRSSWSNGMNAEGAKRTPGAQRVRCVWVRVRSASVELPRHGGTETAGERRVRGAGSRAAGGGDFLDGRRSHGSSSRAGPIQEGNVAVHRRPPDAVSVLRSSPCLRAEAVPAMPTEARTRIQRTLCAPAVPLCAPCVHAVPAMPTEHGRGIDATAALTQSRADQQDRRTTNAIQSLAAGAVVGDRPVRA